MASTYSTNLKIELIGTGEQAGTWGTTTNSNLGTALEQAIVGKADVTMSSATITLTLTNSNAAQDARAIYLNLTGSPGGAAVLEVPAIEKPYIVKNGSDQQVTIKVSGQTGVPIPTLKTALVYNNGTDVVTAIDFIPSLFLAQRFLWPRVVQVQRLQQVVVRWCLRSSPTFVTPVLGTLRPLAHFLAVRLTARMRWALGTRRSTPSLRITPWCLRILVRRSFTRWRMTMHGHLRSRLTQVWRIQ
jgi:hypothetical protein